MPELKFLSFAEKDVDSFLMMQCTDLARTFTKRKELEVAYNFLAYYDPEEAKLYMSRFWDPYPSEQKVLGLKSDIYLHSLGYAQETDYRALSVYLQSTRSFPYPLFAYQLFAMAEELRLTDLCLSKRKGTKKAFQFRKVAYQTHYRQQLKWHTERKHWADALLCALYLHLTTEDSWTFLDIPEELKNLTDPLLTDLFQLYEQESTGELANLCMKQWPRLESQLTEDTRTQYFMLYTARHELTECSSEFTSLTRQSELKNDDTSNEELSGNEDTHTDKLPTWHRETEQPTQSFLQFELESGTKMKLHGGTPREAEAGDQALGSVQASTRATKGKDFTLQELQELNDQRPAGNHNAGDAFGKANRHAVLLSQPVRKPTSAEIAQYQQYVHKIAPWKKKLQSTIEKTLEHKKNNPVRDLQAGRLGHHLLRLWTEKQPRLFYKKNQESKQVDACFSLLIDCSSSMINKMEQTKRGAILFHETLKALQLKHSIHGYWEDALQVTESYQPNYLHEVVNFQESLFPQSGYPIMQLSPQEDNRDGFIIRRMTAMLQRRTEKQKVMLIFSDGEPAAAGYEEEGILDTYQAVVQARKMGLTVIGIFLSTEDIQEQDKKAMQNIYGKQHLLVNDVEDLPDHLTPLLKQLILKQIV